MSFALASRATKAFASTSNVIPHKTRTLCPSVGTISKGFSPAFRAPQRLGLSRNLSIKAQDSMAETTLGKDTPEDVWKKILTAEQFHVLRQAGTERAGTGEYNKHYEEGTYVCAGCGTPLYTSETKFNSGCGWPAFYDEIPGAVERREDMAFGMKRVEIVCTNCKGHLGHVFEGENFPTPTNQRHCVNSLSLKFKKDA